MLACGGPVIAFLVLATLGAIRAWGVALEKIQSISPAINGQALDGIPMQLIWLYIYATNGKDLGTFAFGLQFPYFPAGALAKLFVWLTCLVTLAQIISKARRGN